MNKSILVLALAMSSGTVFAQTQKPAAKAPVKNPVKPVVKTTTTANPFKNNTDSASYAVGVRIMQNLKSQGFDNVNLAMLQKAMTDVSKQQKPLLDDAAIGQCLNKYQEQINSVKQAEQTKANAAISAVSRQQGKAFLDNNSKRAGVVTLPSGLQYEVLTAGTGTEHPTLLSKVKCHYTGTLINGTKFDSSVDRGEPITFPLSNVIQGWQQAVQLMTVGSKWRLYIPADLAYGDNPQPGGVITPGATLLFDVELLGIEN